MSDTTTSGDLVAIASKNALQLFTDDKEYSQFYAKVRAESLDPNQQIDTSTAKGREEIVQRAFRVTKAKTTLDKLALGLTEDWRTKTAAVNASRKKMTTELDALAKEVRQPVTAWEAAEAERREKADEVLNLLRQSALVDMAETAEQVKARGVAVWNTELDAALLGDRLQDAEELKANTVAVLRAAYLRLTKEEADAAELAQLRAENAARAEREAEDARLKAEADYIEAEKRAEAQRRADNEARQAEAIQKAKDDAAAEAIAAERRAADEKAAEARRLADLALQAERDRVAALEFEAQAERYLKETFDRATAAQAETDAARAKNQAHRRAVQTAAKEALMTCGADEDTARKIVLAIIAGEIPAVTMGF